MANMDKLVELNEKLKSIEEYCEQNKDRGFDALYAKVEGMVEEAKEFAKEHGLPLKISTHDIVEKYTEEEESESDDYEESSSSYYEEESSYEEEPEEDSDHEEESSDW